LSRLLFKYIFISNFVVSLFYIHWGSLSILQSIYWSHISG